MRRLSQVVKRDGRLVPFDARRIAEAIYKASLAVGDADHFVAEELAGVVGLYLERSHGDRVPSIEDVQDVVERVLIDTGHAKTAKAYILYRDRRAAARAALTLEEEVGERALPLVESDTGDGVSGWSKARIAAALVAEAGLDADAAADVARTVEERVLGSGVTRLSTSLVRALVDSELFGRGHVTNLSRQRIVGLPKHDLGRLLLEAPPGARASNPEELAMGVGEDLLRQYALEEIVPAAVGDAHRVGDLHLYDLGAPLRMPSVALSTEGLIRRHLRGESTPRSGGPRRITAAVSEAVLEYAPFAGRVFALEDVNVHFAPFVDRLDEEGLHQEVREFLLSPALASFPRRGGLLRLEIGLAGEVPERLARRPVPPPAPPGKVYADHEDASLRTARAFLAAIDELRRDGVHDRLPLVTVTVPRAGQRDAAARALLREALALSSEVGDPLVVLEEPGEPSRGTRWLRIRQEEAADPMRFDDGDVSAATVTAVNLVAAALRAGPGHTEAFFAEVDRLVALALDGAAARREFMRRRGEHPDGSLYPLGRGDTPLLDVEGAHHLIEPVGADRAAGLLSPASSGGERAALRHKLVRYVQARAVEEGGRMSLLVATVEAPCPEAAMRFAEVDAARFDTAAGWWADETPPSYLTAEPASYGVRREPAYPGRGRRTHAFVRASHRIDADRRPPLDELVASFEKAAADPAVVEYRVDPWPRRVVRRPA